MPSYTQLQSEPWWIREYQPPTLADLCQQLRDFFGVTAAALGSKGDNEHLYGYHRSRAWVLNSAYSEDGSADYSVLAPIDRAGDENWLCAVDFTPGSVDTLIEVCQRLDAAVRAGQCPQLREWYGNVDGDQVVDGWDLLRGRAATSDSSHLWHLHMSFLRGRAGDDHSNLFAILTGDDMADYGSLGPPPNEPEYAYAHPDVMLADLHAALVSRKTGWGDEGSAGAWALFQDLAALNAKLDRILAALPGGTAPGGVAPHTHALPTETGSVTTGAD